MGGVAIFDSETVESIGFMTPRSGALMAEEPQARDEAEDQLPELPKRTPLYEAMNAPRYARQAQIRELQDQETRLLCYVAAGAKASLSRDDVLPMVDLFNRIPAGSNIDLLLHTPGGDVDAAEKIAYMLRQRVGDSGKLRIIVPDYAKSAGTLVTLAADTVIMSESSELGPVDPQLTLPDGSGGTTYGPAQSYVDAYEQLVNLVNKGGSTAGYEQMLAKFDPTTLDVCRKVLDRSIRLSERLLTLGMFRQGGNVTAVARELNKSDWHGAPIDFLQAKKLGLNATYLESTDRRWAGYWNLYCAQRLELTRHADDCKLFESDFVSIPMS